MARKNIRSIADARRALGKLITDFKAGTVSAPDARVLCYLLSTFVAVSKDTELEDRVKALETAAGGGK